MGNDLVPNQRHSDESDALLLFISGMLETVHRLHQGQHYICARPQHLHGYGVLFWLMVLMHSVMTTKNA